MHKAMYEDSLLAMEYFLKEIGEGHWLKWIQKDLDEWASKRSVTHHLSDYSIPDGAESWVDPVFTWLKPLCFFFAKNPEEEYSLSELKERISYHDASLSAFVGGESAPNEMRWLFGSKQSIWKQTINTRLALSRMRAWRGK
ncbi:MAG: hypothetical protein ACJA04_000362 [Cellvibrionaceae bacterium]|jgi:hypothetical protein